MAIPCYSTGTTVRDVDPSSVGMMEGAFFVSRTELLDWVNTNFNLSLTKVEQAASGAVYLQIVDALYGGNACVVPMAKVKWNCKHDYEYIQNYKLLQAVFNKQGIKKHIEVDRLIKGKYQDNLEFLQWLKAFYDRQAPAQLQQRALSSSTIKPYSAVERRKLAGSVFPDWAQPSESCAAAAADVLRQESRSGACSRGRLLQSSSSSGVTAAGHALTRCSSSSSHCSAAAPAVPAGAAGLPHRLISSARVLKQQQQHETTCSSSSSSESSSSSGHAPPHTAEAQQQVEQLQKEVIQLKDFIHKLETEGEQAWLEREFYFKKLRRLEIMCTTPGAVSLSTKEILAVLYATDDEAETQATAADEAFAAPEAAALHAQKETEHDETMHCSSNSNTSEQPHNNGNPSTVAPAHPIDTAILIK